MINDQINTYKARTKRSTDGSMVRSMPTSQEQNDQQMDHWLGQCVQSKDKIINRWINGQINIHKAKTN